MAAVAAGIGACAAPGVVAAVCAWWWVELGLALGVGTALVCAGWWAHLLRRRALALGAVAGVAAAAICALMFAGALRVATGQLQSLEVTADPPGMGRIFKLSNAQPFGPLHVPPPTRRQLSNPNRVFYEYLVITPLRAAGDTSATEYAWGVCEVSLDRDSLAEQAKRQCQPQLAAADAWWRDESNGLRGETTAAQVALSLPARPGALVAFRVSNQDVAADVVMPILMLFAFGLGSVLQTKKSLELLETS